MNPSLIPVAPGFDEPLEMLEACHERLQSQLQTLDRLARWLPEHGADPEASRAAEGIMRYFDVSAVNHHLDEERDLFPVLLERVGASRRLSLESLVEWILEDHQRMFAGWAEMRQRLDAIVRGEPHDLPLEETARFTERYVFHIGREEGELFPFARDLLTDDDIARLGLSMTRRRRPPAPGGQ